ncbi:MAG: CopG family ribbon-helix-helix protein [Methylocystis sp.]|jgi:predicted transcriptional regulator
MTATTTLTIRVSAELKDKLARLAQDTRRSKSFLAAEAVSAYVDSELQIIEGVRRGIRDVEAGRVVPHDEAMAEIRGAIEAASRKRPARSVPFNGRATLWTI